MGIYPLDKVQVVMKGMTLYIIGLLAILHAEASMIIHTRTTHMILVLPFFPSFLNIIMQFFTKGSSRRCWGILIAHRGLNIRMLSTIRFVFGVSVCVREKFSLFIALIVITINSRV